MLQHPHILIAEDGELHRRVLTTLFETHLPAAQLTIVTNGAETLLVYQAIGADCLITDWRMPGLDGAALTATLRAEGPTLPIVLMSIEPEREHAALAAGATCFVAKHALARELLPTVHALLNSNSARTSDVIH